MFSHSLLAFASVSIHGASSTESALVFFRFPMEWTLRSLQTAFIIFLMIYVSNIFVGRQKYIKD